MWAMAPNRNGQYEYLDHTADVRIRAWGESMPAVLAAMVEGVLALINEGNLVAAREERCITARGEFQDECIVNFFNELLFQIEGERWLPRGVMNIVYAPDRIEAVLVGEPFDPDRHALASELKAATYHEFSVRETGGEWELRMVFDV
jgi:SHS2 domain-containing protein